jgi:hypothetical protein
MQWGDGRFCRDPVAAMAAHVYILQHLAQIFNDFLQVFVSLSGSTKTILSFWLFRPGCGGGTLQGFPIFPEFFTAHILDRTDKA